MSEAWIIDGVRTPRGKGKPGGGLHDIHPQQLMAQCLNALVGRTGVSPSDVEDVIIGNASNIGDHGHSIARLSVLSAGWPVEVPGLTLNRFCGSGQQAVTVAAMAIASGMQDLVVGGGVESMSRWPVDIDVLTLDGKNPDLRAKYPIVHQGIAADLIATLEGFSREDCDALALTSQQRAAKAIAEGRFSRSMVPVVGADGAIALDHEEHPRPGTTAEALAGLSPGFAELGRTLFEGYSETFDEMCLRTYPQLDRIEHVHHAGNSSGVVDGASALLLASPDYARAHDLRPRARIKATGIAGVDPVVMLTGPAPASRQALAKAGMAVGDIDVWEVNEAFAAVVLKTIRDLGLDPAVVNPNGGAMALGHPIGASGGMLIETALDELDRTDGSTALITMCTGGGMATATIIERI